MHLNTVTQSHTLPWLQSLPQKVAHTCVTSPPYWGLRDYGIEPVQWPEVSYRLFAGMQPITIPAMLCNLGLEETPEAFIGHMVTVFREVHRVLRDDGTLWLNIGDTYYAGKGTSGAANSKQVAKSINTEAVNYADYGETRPQDRKHEIIKPKDMCGIPWMLAFALRADGWYLRQDIIWSKPNPMPESVTDRCTKAHEYIFLLTKNKKYYFDQKAIAVPYADKTYTTFGTGGGDGFGDGSGLVKSENWNSSIKERKPKIWKSPAGWDTSSGNGGHGAFHRGGREQNKKEWNPEHGGSGSGFKGHSGNYDTEGNLIGTGKANRRDVWHHEDHQSLLHWLGHNHPDQLRQFLAESGHMTDIWEVATKPFKEAHFATFPMDLIEPCILAGCPIDGIVLEPFAGSNTTGITSLKLQRNYLACELKPEYINIADRRDLAENGLFSANHTQSINQPTT